MADCPLQLLPDQPARFVNHGWHDCGSGLLRRSGGIASTGVRPSPPRREGPGASPAGGPEGRSFRCRRTNFGGGCFAELPGRRFSPHPGAGSRRRTILCQVGGPGRDRCAGLKLTGFGWRSRSSSRSRRCAVREHISVRPAGEWCAARDPASPRFARARRSSRQAGDTGLLRARANSAGAAPRPRSESRRR